LTETTQIVKLDVERTDGVKNPANGFPFLLLKAVNSVGGIDEGPDIDGAEHVLQLIAKLIMSEASEMAAGAWDESCDIELLSEAATLIKYFRCREIMNDEDDGHELAKEAADLFVKAHRKFSADDRKRLASEGKALEDGSYPIPDADALRRAAILARSGHGNVAAAKRLIAKRARELGAKNPLARSDDASKEDTQVDDTTKTPTPNEGEATDAKPVDDIVKEAIAEATKSHEEAIKELRDELAKVKATAIPGGPAMTTPAHMRSQAEKAEKLVEAAHFSKLAEQVNDQDLKKYYKERAAACKSAAA
jgi:hypothetical protein